MPRLYGASTADFTIGLATVGETASVVTLLAGVRLAVSTSPDAADRVLAGITDLGGSPVAEVVTDADGEIRFLGDDALPLDLWLTPIDSESGELGTKWYLVRATTVGEVATSAAQAASGAEASAQNAAAVASLARIEAGQVAAQVTQVDAVARQSATLAATAAGTAQQAFGGLAQLRADYEALLARFEEHLLTGGGGEGGGGAATIRAWDEATGQLVATDGEIILSPHNPAAEMGPHDLWADYSGTGA